jgi:hypothetical protein
MKRGENNNPVGKFDSISKIKYGCLRVFLKTNANINSAKVRWAANSKLSPLITKFSLLCKAFTYQD